jgi:hypothetical protein
MYHYSFNSAGRGNGRGAMPFLMSFTLEPEIVTLAWMDNASVQFPLNIYATKESGQLLDADVPELHWITIAGNSKVARASVLAWVRMIRQKVGYVV